MEDGEIIKFILHRSLMILVIYILANKKVLFFELIFGLEKTRNVYYNSFFENLKSLTIIPEYLLEPPIIV